MITPLIHSAVQLPLQQIQFNYGLLKQGGLNTILQPLRVCSLIEHSLCFITCWTSLDVKHKISLLQILCLLPGPRGTTPESLEGPIPENSSVCELEWGLQISLFSCLSCSLEQAGIPTSFFPERPGKQEQQVHSSFPPSFCCAFKHF